MNELIGTSLIIIAVFAIGGLIFLGDKITPWCKSFIKWQITRFHAIREDKQYKD